MQVQVRPLLVIFFTDNIFDLAQYTQANRHPCKMPDAVRLINPARSISLWLMTLRRLALPSKW